MGASVSLLVVLLPGIPLAADPVPTSGPSIFDDATSPPANAPESHAPALPATEPVATPTEPTEPGPPTNAPDDSLARARAALASNPADPDANLQVGRYLCLTENKWHQGLLNLRKGSDSTLKDLAIFELSLPADRADQIRLADGWWSAASNATDDAKQRMLAHAGTWYAAALLGATGLAKVRIEKRLAALSEVSTRAPQTLDLLKGLDLAADSVQGEWRMDNGALTTSSSGSNFDFGYRPPAEYDCKIVFSRTPTGDEQFSLVLYSNGRQFKWAMGANRPASYGFSILMGDAYQDNSTTVRNHAVIQGTRYTCLVKVRKDHLEAYLDGKLVSQLKTDYRDITTDIHMRMHRPDTLGIATYATRFLIHSLQITELNNAGKMLTSSDPVEASKIAELRYFRPGDKDGASYTLFSNGHINSPNGIMKWQLHDRKILFLWDDAIHSCYLSEDGKHLIGTTRHGAPVSGDIVTGKVE